LARRAGYRQIGIEAAWVAVLVGYKAVQRDVVPTITFANGASESD